MVNERYPADTTIDKSDFDKEHCQRILDDSTGDGYTSSSWVRVCPPGKLFFTALLCMLMVY
jgi:hypothetical protein